LDRKRFRLLHSFVSAARRDRKRKRLSAKQPAVAASAHQEYVDQVYGLARLLLLSEAEVERVAQEVLEQFLEKLATLPNASEAFAWLHRATIDRAVLHYRKQEQQQLPPGAATPAVWRHGDPGARRQIERAIARLPEIYRDPFVLADIEGLANHEVGALLGLSAASVQARLHRARLLVRDGLGPVFAKGHLE